MPNIDERVVQMTFDNKQFESGVSESLKTLDDLKKALNFDGVEGSLKNIENAFNNLNLSGLAESVDFIASRFEPLGKIADAALGRIADKALDAGKKVADAFFGFSDMSAGQSKYETYTKAVQTITNATGKSVAEVEKVLGDLQKYTDETSYDFSEMVTSIGKFTSAGVDLEVAEESMEGIANWAAKSGAGIQEANRAFYNLSQSMATGSVKLIDWRSIENANMSTKEFKELAIETAIELGVLQDRGNGIGSIVTTNEEKLKKAEKALDKAKAATKDRDAKIAAAQEQVAAATKETTVDFKNFNDTLSEGWFTSDVLLKVLEKYANDQTAYEAAQKALSFSDAVQAVKDALSSGWMESYKYIFGNLDEAKVLWTDVANAMYDYVAIFIKWRNEVLKSWHEMGGYNDLIEAASNLWQTFMNIVKGVGKALTNVFPILKPENMTQALYDGTKALKEWSADLLEMFGLQQKVQEEEEKTAEKAEEIANKTDEITESVTEATKAVSGLREETANVATDLGAVETGLKRGMRGENVKKLQKQLIKLGFRLDKYGADGIFGPETQGALKALQREIGVAETGIMDEATKAALQTEEALLKLQKHADKGIRIGARGDDIKSLQKQLNKYLNDSEQLVVDGIFGPKTEAAIKKIQEQLGVAQTGVWDQNTKTALKTGKHLLMEYDKMSKEFKKGMSGKDIKAFQEQLVKGGYLDKSLANGIYGPETKAAVAKLQKDLGIKETGEWDRLSYIALTNSQEITRNTEVSERANKKAVESAKEAVKENKEAAEESEKTTQHTTVAMMRLQNIVKGWGAALKIAGKFAGAITEIAGNILGMFKPLIDVGYRFGSVFGVMFENLAKDLDKDNVYGNFVKNVTKAFAPFGSFIQNVANGLNTFLDAYDSFLESTGKRNTFGNFFGFLKNYIKQVPAFGIIANVFETVKSVVGPIITFLIDKIKTLFGLLKVGFGSASFKQGKDSVFTWISEKLAKLKESISKFKEDHPELTIENFINKIKEVGGWLGGKFGEGFDVIKNKFTEFKVVIDKFVQDHPEISISNIFGKIKGVFSDIGDMFSGFFASGQQSESGSFFDELKARFKAFEPVLGWMEGIKDRIVKLWQSIFGGGEEIKATVTPKGSKPSTAPMVKTMEVVEEKLSTFDKIVNWFIGIKDKFISAWNDLLGVSKGEGMEPPKEGAFVSVADKLKDFGKWILDNWPAISLAVIGIGASYALVSAIQVARNLGKGFKDLGGALKSLFGKEDPKDTIGTAALKIAGAIMIVAAAIGLLSIIDANKAWDGIKGFLTVLGAMALAIILINKLGGQNDDGAKQALMLAGSIGIIAAAIWLMCTTIKQYAEGGVIVWAVVIIGLMLGALAAIAIYLTKQPGQGIELKGFLAMCAGVLVLVIAFKSMMKTLTKYIDKPGTVIAAFLIIEAMLITLGAIAILMLKNSEGSQTGAHLDGFLKLCVGVLVLVVAFKSMMKTLTKYIDKPGTVIAAFLIIEAMLITLGAIAILMLKNSEGSQPGVKLDGFLKLCSGVYVLVLAFKEMMKTLVEYIDKPGTVIAAFLIIEAMLITLGALSIKLAKTPGKGSVKILGMLALVGALWVIVEVFGRLVTIISQNNPGVITVAMLAIAGLLGGLVYIAETMNKSKHPFIGAIGNAITFTTLAYAMDKIVRAIGDVIYKIKDVDPEILKWFFIGIDGAIAIMAATVAVLGKLFASNPIGLLIGEAGLLALFGVLAAAIDILAKVADSALKRFSSTIKYLGWGMESFDKSTSNINLERLKKVGEFLKDNLPQMVKSVLGITTTGLQKKMNAIQDMGNKIQLFAVAVSAVDQKALNGASNSKTLMEKADEIADSLNDASLPDLGKLGSLYMFGTGLYAYGYTLSQMKAGDETTVANVISQTTDLLGIVTDKGKIEQATSSIQALGGALGIYFKALDTREIGENGQAVENTPLDIQAMAQKMRELVGAFTQEEIDELTSYGDGKQRDMGAVANGISQLSLAFGSYADNIGKLKKDDIERANGVIDKIQGMTYDQTKIDGFSDGFSGINVPGAFVVALQIFGLGLALSSYAENIGKLSATQVKNANDVLDEFIKIYEMKDKLTSPSNVLDLLWKVFHSDTDEFNLTQFSADVAGVGNALKVYGDGIVGLNIGKVFLANRVLNSLLNVANELTQDNWWSQLLFGNKSFGDFADNVGSLGGGLRDFGDSISGATFDTSKIETVFKEGGIIDQLLSLLKRTDGVDLYMTDFASNMTVFKSGPIATAIKTFFDNLALAFSDEETNNSAVKALGSAGQSIIDNIANGIANANISGLQTSIFNAIDTSMVNASPSIVVVMNTLGEDILSWIKSGLENEESIVKIIDSIKDLVEKIKIAFTSKFDDFKGIGKFIDQGVAIGISDNAPIVINAIEDVVWGALLAAKKKLGIASPSKEFMYLGEMVDEGFVKGLLERSGKIKDAGEMTLDELKELFAEYGLEIDESMKIQPEENLFPLDSYKEVINKEAEEAGKSGGQSLIEGIRNAVSNFAASIMPEMKTDYSLFGNVSEELLRGVDEDTKNAIEELGNYASTRAQTAADTIGTFVNSVGENVSTGFDDIKKTIGTSIELFKHENFFDVASMNVNSEQLAKAYMRQSGFSEEAIQTVIENAANNGSDAAAPTVQEVGKQALAKVAEGLADEAKRRAAEYAMRKVLEQVAVSAKDKNTEAMYDSVGQYMDSGVAKGLSYGSNNVTRMAVKVAVDAYLAAKKALGIASPSREFMWLGEMADIGLTKGLEYYSRSVSNAAGNVADGAIDTATKGVMALSDAIGFNDIDQPVIRPVLDLSDIRAGSESIHRILTPSPIVPSRSSALASGIASSQRTRQIDTQEKSSRNQDMSNLVDKFNEKIDAMTEEIKNFKIYMDGTTLVGYMSPRVNRSLGQQVTLAGRMN